MGVVDLIDDDERGRTVVEEPYLQWGSLRHAPALLSFGKGPDGPG